MDVPFNSWEEPGVERPNHADIQRVARRLGNAELRRTERLLVGKRLDPEPPPSRNSLRTLLIIILIPAFLLFAYYGLKILLLLIIAMENIL
ncbi:MAG: hypothetical protein WCO26_00585 [Deltaproteobacteria bacterium]